MFSLLVVLALAAPAAAQEYRTTCAGGYVTVFRDTNIAWTSTRYCRYVSVKVRVRSGSYSATRFNTNGYVEIQQVNDISAHTWRTAAGDAGPSGSKLLN